MAKHRERFNIVFQVMLAVQLQTQIVHKEEYDDRQTRSDGYVCCRRFPPENVSHMTIMKIFRRFDRLPKHLKVSRQVCDDSKRQSKHVGYEDEYNQGQAQRNVRLPFSNP